ncbi:hypothetical protein AD006_29195 (plasmid) [Pseudonocardia sp. EC080610-09]|uniref:ImmA/IrrE family metallo-endopeptidase n=1 Tax=unclassified Pseudonocardia TaxID=2619320 RepID=UPI000705DB06|nr:MULTISPECIES: ImmA/IrrE family metallo-endopeptidase [unclassified Pseudonocardia]ALL79362.1 hypothetical protein AD006_29195 [Pseudonocardia sp. EC080610-09]ALL85334.1 hypothetical protein AD017_29585 [Pseudonocardia sp. EC080619-01]
MNGPQRLTPLEVAARDEAQRFRAEHHLGAQPMGDLVTLIEQHTGVDVLVMEAGEDEHGLTMRDPQRGAMFIAVARTRRPMRQRSCLAHELGHMLFDDYHPGPATVGPRWKETRADAFARHLLLPHEGLDLLVDGRPGDGPATLSSVVQRFLVSPAIAAIAMAQRGHISETTKQQWMATFTAPTLATRFGWRDLYASLALESDRSRAPQKLLARTLAGYRAGVISARTLANIRGLGVEELLAELDAAGVAVDAPQALEGSALPATTLKTSLPRPKFSVEELDELLGSVDDDPHDVPGSS